MFDQKRFYVYMLVHPLYQIPFYVGKGCDDRCNAHLLEAKRPIEKQVNPLKCKIINSIVQMGLEPQIKKVQESMDEQAAFDLETELIAQYKRIIDGGCLSNISEGGEQVGKSKFKAVFCYTLDGIYQEEFKSLLHAADSKGIHKSTLCSALNERSKTAGGYRWSYKKHDCLQPVNLNKHISPVIQYDLLGNEIRRFSSIKEAAKATNVTFTSIVECCSSASRQTTSGKYRWSYINNLPKPLTRSPIYYKNKQIIATDPCTGNEITYLSLSEAVKHTAANKTGIIDCCAGRKKKSGGLYWKYAPDF